VNLPGPDIFLSYNREDQAVAKRFAEAFEAAGFSVWWDVTLRSGEAYDAVTEEALRTAKAVVVLWSPRSVVSRWVRAEATMADRNRTLVPARIEACDLPIMFELTQTADLSQWHGETGDPAWKAFLGDVRRMVGARSEPAGPIPQAAVSSPSRGSRPSIAVLPFVNRSGVTADDVFADGMVEDVTVALSLSRRMKVIAASATATYRTGARDLRQIGSDLGVRYLLEGNVRRAADDLRVTAQLVEADDGDILWTQKFDRPITQLSALQEELATEVATQLGIEIERAEMEHALKKPGDITAWEAVLRAEAGLTRQTRSSLEAALASAGRAIEIEPDYDAAYAVQAIALAMLRDFRVGDETELTQRLVEVVARLLALDSDDPVVLARIATALMYLGRHEDALPIAERAVSINPNLELPHVALGSVLIHQGRSDDAIAELRAAERLAPNGIWYFASLSIRASLHMHAGQFEQALEATDQSLRIRPIINGHLHRMICLERLGRGGEARDVMRRLREADPRLSWQAMEKIASTEYAGFGADRHGEFVAILRQLWDGTEATL
jgi:TolB-like protein/Tfp pilus assembly protein PilF